MDKSNELQRFADVITDLILKYYNKVDWDSLPDQPLPEE